MSSSVLLCPCFSNKTVDKEFPAPGWKRVSFWKRDNQAQFIQANDKNKIYTFWEELSTGDLYYDEDSVSDIRMKCAMIAIGTPLYTALMMAVSVVRIAVDVANVAWTAFAEMSKTWTDKGLTAALFKIVFAFVWVIPTTVAQDLWRVVRSPLYGAGLFLVAAYGIVNPADSRAYVGRIEGEWHEGATYRDDLRYEAHDDPHVSENDCGMKDFKIVINRLKQGRIHFLAWCMQPRGNVNDKVAKSARFALAIPHEEKIENPNEPSKMTTSNDITHQQK